MDSLNKKLKRLTSNGSWDILANDNHTCFTACDGPHGLRYVVSEDNGYQKDEPSYAYPTLSFLGNTWNKELAYRIGKAIGEDCRQHNVSMILGPGVNIKRTPLCGRNFEYFSEDPLLSGEMGRSYIEGVQSVGVGACLKHFAANNREYDRFFQSSEVDERTLHEIYFKPFELALKAKPWGVMCSYNPVNGILASENEYLLKTILRQEFKYSGLIISDWGSVRNRAKSLKAGIDVAFPYNDQFENQLEEGLKVKYINEQEVNQAISRVDEWIEKAKKGHELEYSHDFNWHEQLCIDASEEGIVLLKNNNILPLKTQKNVLLVGEFLMDPPICGGGSSKVTPKTKPLDLLSCLKKYDAKTNYTYVQGYMMRYGLPTPFGYKNALSLASSSDAIIVGIGNTALEEKEETDRESIKLKPVFVDLIKKLSFYNKNIIVVLYCGSAVDVSDFIDNVSSLVLAGYGGQAINEGLAKILLGQASPSGRLSETWPACLEDTYTNNEVGNSFVEVYTDRTLVGYRYYLNKQITPRFPFGYGLSYLNIKYDNLSIVEDNNEFKVSFDIENLSPFEGKEVVQLYIRDLVSTVERPYRELKRFKKIYLNKNEKKRLEFVLTKEDLKFYSPSLKRWYLENGEFDVQICKNAENVLLSKRIVINEDYWNQYSQF